jgi:hypothetical protein
VLRRARDKRGTEGSASLRARALRAASRPGQARHRGQRITTRKGAPCCAALGTRQTRGTTATIERRTGDDGRAYNFLKPSKLTETYERSDGRRLKVIRRRGFGQIALSRQFSDRSLGVFMHRGDSPGESGSNVYWQHLSMPRSTPKVATKRWNFAPPIPSQEPRPTDWR